MPSVKMKDLEAADYAALADWLQDKDYNKQWDRDALDSNYRDWDKLPCAFGYLRWAKGLDAVLCRLVLCRPRLVSNGPNGGRWVRMYTWPTLLLTQKLLQFDLDKYVRKVGRREWYAISHFTGSAQLQGRQAPNELCNYLP